MTTNPAEAAAKYRSLEYRGLGNWYTPDGELLDQEDVTKLRAILAEAYLEQNPADDEEAITPALLESHGFYQPYDGGSWTRQDIGWYLLIDSGSVFFDECEFCTVANKGEFLRLLRFVGILK